MDQELIIRAQQGDHGAFLELLSRYDRQIMSVVYRFTGNFHDREDLYQEVFLHCFKAIRSFRFQAAFQTWLYRLALNRCLVYCKRNPPPTAEAEPVDRAIPVIEGRARVRAVQNALTRLKGPQRISFHLYYVEEWTLDEIAAVLACRPGTVKSHLDRARTKIKKSREVRPWLGQLN